jgi:hypothetical protein
MESIIRYAYLKLSTKNQQTITTNLLTEFGKIAYISGPLSQWVRLSYFSSKLQTYIRKVSNGLQKWSGCVLLDLKNPTQLTALKTVERSSRNWPAKFPSSMASLHKNVFGFTILQHFSCSELVWTVKNLWFIYILIWGSKSNFPPTFWPQIGLRSPSEGQKSSKITKNQLKIH